MTYENKVWRSPSAELRYGMRLLMPRSGQKGRRALFIHGNPGQSTDLLPLAEMTSSFAEVALLDLPGFGGQPLARNEGAYSLHTLAQLVLAATGELCWDDGVYLVGHSHGAAIGLAAAVQQPAISAVAMISSLGGKRHSAYRQLAFPGTARAMKGLQGFFATKTGRAFLQRATRRVVVDAYAPDAPSDAELESMICAISERPETMLAMALLAKDDPCSETLALAGRVQVPTLFLHGGKDRIVPIEKSRLLHERRLALELPSSFEEVERGGHMMCRTHAQSLACLVDQL